MKEIKEIKGIIEAVRQDKKALKIAGEWLSSFVTIDDYKAGDNVKATYSVNEKNGKVFNNLKDIRLEKETKLEVKNVSDTTINCLLMQSVQLAKDKGLSLEMSTERVLDSYKRIKESI